MENENGLATRQTSRNLYLSNSLNGIRQQLENAAQQNLNQFLNDTGDDYTEMEKLAMLKVEELKLINGMDLATVYFRGDIVREIRENALWTVHPEGYQSLEQMAQAQGISVSELSKVVTFTETIFPFIEDHLHMNVADLWEEIGKSNFSEMVPVLKALITGEDPGRGATANTVETLREDAAATNAASGITVTDDELRDQIVEGLLADGSLMTSRQFRSRLRPERTNPIEAIIINKPDGTKSLIANLTEEQHTLLMRKLDAYLSEINFSIPNDPRQRVIEASRIRPIREIASLLVEE